MASVTTDPCRRGASERDRIARLVADFSIEALPRGVLRRRTDLGILRPGTSVFLTRIAKKPFRDTLAAAIRVRELGFRPVPHLTARTIRSAHELRDEVAALVREAGVDEILLVAGSQAHPAGAFDGTMDVLRTGIFERAGIKRVGLAGHPEGHPDVEEARLQSALDQKNDFARTSELECYLITQFFFDAAPVIAWERRIRELGNALPIRIGLHGLTGTASLLRLAVACGIGASLDVLTKHVALARLAFVRTPEPMLVEFAAAIDADPDTLFRGVHFFPLGDFARTARFANALALRGPRAFGVDETVAVGAPSP